MLPEMSLKYRNLPSTAGVEDTEPNPGEMVPVSAVVRYSHSRRRLPTLLLSIGPPLKLRVFWMSIFGGSAERLVLPPGAISAAQSSPDLILKIFTRASFAVEFTPCPSSPLPQPMSRLQARWWRLGRS